MKLKILLLVALFLFRGGVFADEPSITVELYEDGNETMPVILLDKIGDATDVIVRTFYWADYPGVQTKIVLGKVSVQSAFEGSFIATDSVPVPKDEIFSVQVTLAKTVRKQDFKFKQVP